MADPTLETPPPVSQTPPPENVNGGGNVAPHMDEELDAALDKAFSSKGTPAPEPKPKEAPVEPVNPKEPVKTESKVEPKVEKAKAPEGDLPNPDSVDQTPAKKQDGWNALKNNYKRAHKMVADREEEIKRLKAGLADKSTTTTKEVEALKNEIKELSKYRTMIDIQADPEFVSKHDQPLAKASGALKEMLMGMKVSKELVDQIDFRNTKLMDEITGHIEEHMDKFQAKKFQRKVEEILDIMEKRDETLSEHGKNYAEFMEQKKKESSIKGAENEGRMIRHLESVTIAKDKDGNVLFPFLNKIEPKEGATQAEADQATNHNHLVEVMQKKLNEAMKYEEPEARAELAVAAVSAHYLKAQLNAAIQKIKGLEAEVAKISTISSDTERSKPRNPTGRNGSSEPVDVDTALANHFSR